MTAYTEYFPPHLSSVPIPAGATVDPNSVEWSEMYPGSGYTRLLHWVEFQTSQATASIEGMQDPDGTFTRELVLYAERDGKITPDEARQIAAMLIEAADAMDALK